MMHTFFSDCRIIYCTFFLFAKDPRDHRKLTLKDRIDLKPFGHYIIEQYIILSSYIKSFFEFIKSFGIDDHWFISENIESILKRLQNIIRLFLIVSRQYNYISLFFS